jgi:RNA polymerase sigma-70 factor (ECF subfamily)
MASLDGPKGGNAHLERALAAARAGDQSQLGVIFDVYRGYLLTMAREKLAPDLAVKAAPSDVVQDAFVKATQAWPGFHGTTELEFREWLKQILLTMLDKARERFLEAAKRDLSREVPLHAGTNGDGRALDLAAPGASPSGLAQAAENARLLESAMQILPPLEREAVQLRIFQELGFDEVGERLGCSAKTASRIWSRAVTLLTAELQLHEQGPAGPL